MRTTRLHLTALAVLSAFAAFAQPPAGLNAKDAQGRKQGPWERTWAESKQLRYKGQFKDDKPVGTFTYYSTLGKVESIVDNYPTGNAAHARHYHPNGQLMAEGRYVGEQKDSVWNYYDPAGHLRTVERWKAGRKDGEQDAFFSDGTPAEKCLYKADQKNGLCEQFFENGKVRSTSQYVNGEPEGVMTFYYATGKKEIEGSNVNGDHDGTWTYYNEDGTVQLEMVYERGQFIKDIKGNGTFKEYYEDEQLKSEVTWKNGRKEGRFKEYFDNGHWTTKPTTLGPEGEAVRDQERELEGQTVKREGTYRNDQLEGDVKEYNEEGRLLSTTHYTNGVAQAAGKP